MVEFHCGFETAWERERGNYELIMNYEMSRPEGRGPTRLAVVFGASFLHWDELCDELLGEVPSENACKGVALKLTWLLSILRAPLLEE